MRHFLMTVLLISFGTTSVAATFDFCTCEVRGDLDAVGYVYGKSFVKNANGSVTMQKLEIAQVRFDAESSWDQATDKAQRLCELEINKLYRGGICPSGF